MRQKLFLLVVTLLALSLAPIVGALDSGTDATPTSTGSNPDYAFLILKDQPLASYDGHLPGYARTMPTGSQKLNLNSAAAQSYAAYIADQHNAAKGWIASNAAEVQVIDEYSVVLNALGLKLNGHSMSHLLNAPGVTWIAPDNTYHVDDDISNNLIGAPAVWSALGGQGNAGAGMKIGIIDTGIDQTHPFLTDPSLVVPAGFPKCDAIDSAVGQADTSCLFTSNKVIVVKVFETQAKTNFDGHAAQSHGSHVSGIAAGVANTCAPLVGCAMSGVAPKAFLGSYNVFPGNILSASSLDIAKAVEAAVGDGMDILNLSLGGTARPDDVLVNAVNSAVDAGVIVAIAAGNAGPGAGTIESPGIASQVITAGASTDPHFVGIPVTVSGLGTFGAALGQFANFVPAINAPYIVTSPANGCTPISQNLSGDIALIKRGLCSFSTKIRNAQSAGAMGVIVYNNVQGDPTAMGQDGSPNQPTIPAVMVSNANGVAMAGLPSPHSALVDGTTKMYFVTSNADILASFSSIGPPVLQTPGQGNGQPSGKIKPDVVAPGVNVLSSVPSFACSAPPCYAFFSGTSMATPHVAGSAAILKQLHPDWSPEQVKSALVTTGATVKSFTSGAALKNPMVKGGGRINLAQAGFVPATAEADPGQASVDFGVIPASSFSLGEPITLTDTSGTGNTYTITVSPVQASGPAVTAPASITVGAGASNSFVLTLTSDPSILNGDYFGYVVLSNGSATLSIPYWVNVGVNHAGGSQSIRLQ